MDPAWRARIAKEIPVAAGLGGGSADAAAALRLANASLERPLDAERLHGVAVRELGADVPFFLEPGPKLAEGSGERLTALDDPAGLLGAARASAGRGKQSTGEVYARFDELGGGAGFDERKEALLAALEAVRRPPGPRRAAGQRPR